MSQKGGGRERGASARTAAGCLDLFGIDVLLTRDYKPVIIEVNLAPDMGTIK